MDIYSITFFLRFELEISLEAVKFWFRGLSGLWEVVDEGWTWVVGLTAFTTGETEPSTWCKASTTKFHREGRDFLLNTI